MKLFGGGSLQRERGRNQFAKVMGRGGVQDDSFQEARYTAPGEDPTRTRRVRDKWIAISLMTPFIDRIV